MKESDIKGRVLEIQRMSTEDGPGIRTTVFLKGCTLKCKWCHNPESISMKTQLQWLATPCISCKICIAECPNGALSSSEQNEILIDRSKCKTCGTCADKCPTGALEILGIDWSVEELYKELIKDKAYFDSSGGGITISGGEPSIQSNFVLALLKKLKADRIHTALDTCGMTRKNLLDKLLPYCDLILYDIKIFDNDKHIELTAKSNKRILENILYIKEKIKNFIHPPMLWIRTPLIPGDTASKENIASIAKFISLHLKGVISRWELLAFNNLCEDKYTRLSKNWNYKNTNLISKNHIDELLSIIKTQDINDEIIFWSGSLKLE